MMARLFFLLLFFAPFLSFAALPLNPDIEELAKRVVIVVNERDPGSIEVGKHYAERRRIPEENIVRISTSFSETISRDEYVDSIYNPLQKQLLDLGWIDGFSTELKDPEGRFRSSMNGHRMSYLVLCRGIPLRIEHDEERVTEEMRQSMKKEFAVNAASVDSELALMTALLPSIAFVANPLFNNRNPSPADLARVVKVARLDGPSVSDAKNLVDRAIEAEKTGLRGRAYLDLQGPHADGTRWLNQTGDQIEALGFDLRRRDAKGTFSMADRFDAPALYFGWYANDLNGPFLFDGFRFPPGAVAVHIHSFSARTVRNVSKGWVGPLVARGVTATVGNVYEPYLAASHHPQLLFQWIANGGTMGDAAVYSMPALSWQTVFVGDPLYRPFEKSLEDQLADFSGRESDQLAVYPVLRSMNLKIAGGETSAAIEEGEAVLKQRFSLPLALKIAELKAKNHQRRGAIEVLSNLKWRPSGTADLISGKEAADFLSSIDAQDEALALYRVLLDQREIPAILKRPLLDDGILLARRLNQSNLRKQWEDLRDRLSAVD